MRSVEMVFKTTLLALVVAMTMTLCQGQSQDATLQSGAKSAAVVDAVVSKIRSRCVFSQDRQYLRRLAFVMSRDGEDSKTYRAGFHGGIWQVSEPMFTATKACTGATLQAACDSITSAFNINWPAVVWSDLRKPLYSGLAAALSTLLTLDAAPMPGSVSGQADIWTQMYGTGAVGTEFQDNAACSDTEDCSAAVDLAFLLDGSSSISDADFASMLSFAGDVINGMDISSTAVQVAGITFATTVSVQFDFNDYTTKAQARSLMTSTAQLGGRTDTALGLNQVANTMYDTSAGARPNAKKVAVLVTDGVSKSPASTNAAASALKELGTTVLSVGVGNYNLSELQAVASDPICSHVTTLDSFDHILTILADIKKSACDANIVIPEGNSTEGTLPADQHITCPTPKTGNIVKCEVTCGYLDIYASLTVPKPGPAVYDQMYRATPGSPAYLTLSETLSAGTHFYFAVAGTRYSTSRNCVDSGWKCGPAPKKKDIVVICEEDGVRRSCIKNDVVNAGLCTKDDDEDTTGPIENPCTVENLEAGKMSHCHPYDVTKFLLCDFQKNYFVTSCPGGATCNPLTRSCGYTSGSPSSGSTCGDAAPRSDPVLKPANDSESNPCTVQAIARRQFYHTYAADESKFVQCDEWGQAFIMPCAPSTIWSQSHYTCIKKAKVSSALVACSAGDTYLTDPCDHSKYYQCVHGQPQQMACPSGLFYNPYYFTCGRGDVNSASKPAACANASD